MEVGSDHEMEKTYNGANTAVVRDNEGTRIVEIRRLEGYLHVAAVTVTGVSLIVGEVEGLEVICGDIKSLVWFTN